MIGRRPHRFARARHVAGQMNKSEAEYAAHLEAMKRTGLIRDYAYEAVKLRLADATFYTADFLVIAADDVLELHEVKGHWEDDARVKVKAVADRFPWFRFKAFRKLPKKDGGGWAVESFGLSDAPPA